MAPAATDPECETCRRSAPDAPLREQLVRERGWRVAHSFNSSLAGWLVVAPLRHVEAFDELAGDEAIALGDLLRRGSIALRSVTGCVKTYVLLLAEA